MTLVGILHAVITAIIQIYETFVANGFSFTFLGHLFNIFRALIGWIIAGITTTILITSENYNKYFVKEVMKNF
ncbi:hypothetical protein U3516DRAFT_767786 [Neocallimastix sp. 'constans']